MQCRRNAFNRVIVLVTFGVNVLHFCHPRITFHFMKTLTIRLPDPLVAEIENEARKRNVSKSDVVRQRLQAAGAGQPTGLEGIADLIGSVKGLPSDLSSRVDEYLAKGYGRKRHR